MPRTSKRLHAEASDGEYEDVRGNGSNDRANDDNEEDDDDNEHSNKNKKSKKKKVRIMTHSEQTEADRRALRGKQRDLYQDLIHGAAMSRVDEEEEEDNDGGGGGIEDPTSGEFDRVRDRNNALWDDVHYTREAVLDSENMDLLTSKAARQVERMIEVPRYDADRLAIKLVQKCSVRPPSSTSSHFGWQDLGFQVGVCFNALPSRVSFLRGPIDASYQPKERKKPERRKRNTANDEETENAEEERPEELDQTKKKKADGNALSAVEKHIATINKTLAQLTRVEKESALARKPEFMERISSQMTGGEDDVKKKCKKKERAFHSEAGRVNAVQCLFNPQSFTQTVENIFHYSFLVKNNKAGIRVRSAEKAEELGGAGPGPVAYTIDKADASNVNMPPPRQAIVALSMKDWRDMCDAYAVEESDVPHREVP